MEKINKYFQNWNCYALFWLYANDAIPVGGV